MMEFVFAALFFGCVVGCSGLGARLFASVITQFFIGQTAILATGWFPWVFQRLVETQLA